MKDRPDLIVSGINKGLNIGDDVTYSGTVAGAFEGALLGYQAIAVSLKFTRDEWDFSHAAAAAASLAASLLEHPLPPRTFLNLNVPHGTPKGTRVTVQAKRNHITKVANRLDPRGRPYFWIEEASDDWELDPRSDHHAIKDGFISITPLQPDLTDHSLLSRIEALTKLTGNAIR
jgi:5'-nucleotidase